MEPEFARQTPLFVAVVGAPASGKSTYARSLAQRLDAALLDLDTITLPLVEATMAALGGTDIDDPRVRHLTRTARYDALVDTALENLALGRSVVAVAPFTNERSDPQAWAGLVGRVREHGARAQMHWCDTPADVVRSNMLTRAASRDAAKIAEIDAYVAGLDLTAPATEHLRIPWRPHSLKPVAPSAAMCHSGLVLPPARRRELSAHASALGALVARATHADGGFGWLDPRNDLVPDRGVELYMTCRMTHVAALEVLRGEPSARPLLGVGFDALTGRLKDHEHGGWFTSSSDTTKTAYTHAFVVLAASSLVAARHPGSDELLNEALQIIDQHFWIEVDGMVAEQWDSEWMRTNGYRGVNANMHTVEAFLAVYDITRDETYLQRASRMVERVVHVIARGHDWRLPEHFDRDWRVLGDYNRDQPADQFRPYGVTIGHLLEWGRLTLNLRALMGHSAADWMLQDARCLIDAALKRGWHADGVDGFVYTTDFADRPIVRERLHWVVCEAIAATWVVHEATGEQVYRDWFDRLWGYANRHLIDHDNGGWLHELSPTNQPSERVWWGKPDIYHAYQATITPLLRCMTSYSGSLLRQESPDV